ncbi:DUF4365 domain-containing protein [uncultured Chryseobacterium sp.]|uniref:DUF4365 domain-containing protein n=1 Tax=uncultured Chryseobacterium sp. TaxID=259322 RepID=UPI0025E4EB53|nr:DUF4365 domain-containing protein [uncultured Chryseobacterium sp.]
MKKKDNGFIRKEANNLLTTQLRRLFHNDNKNLKENPSTADEDMGIDYYFEVFDDSIPKEPKYLYHIYNQNKGTQSLKIINTPADENFRKIPFSLSIRHAEYFFYELDEALLFTICDINSEKIYWYDIQNDLSLPDRIIEQKSKLINSITIYIPVENILNQETFNNLLKKLDYAKYSQIRKKGKNLNADYSLTEIGNVQKRMIDKIIYTINLFEGIKVLPEKVICKLSPFKGNAARTNISDLALETDNDEFFTFMNSIKIEGEKLVFLNNNVDENDKLREIIDFFQVNNIYHIRWSGNTLKKQICLHNLFHYDECDCERCNLQRLNLLRTYELLNTEVTNTSYELLRRGYTYYLLGDYVKSYEIFYKIYREANKDQNPINYTISKYNLIKLKGFIKSFYFEEDKNEIIKRLDDVKFDNDERFITEYAPYFLDMFKNIKEQKFYDDVFNEIDKNFLKIQRLYYYDKFGETESSKVFRSLQSAFLRFNSYLNHNFIIFNYYQEYTDLSEKILESLFILHSLKNPETEIYELEWYAFELWIFNISEEFLSYLLQKYDILSISADENIFERIDSITENLLNSYNVFDQHSKIFSPLRIGRILNNIVAIITLLEIEYHKKELIILKVLNDFEKLSKHNLIPYSAIYLFATREKLHIRKNVLKKIVDIFILNNKRYNYITVLEYYFEICTSNELEKLINRVLKINNLEITNVENEYFDDLLYSFTLLSKDAKNNLKNKFIKFLDENFDFSLYINLLLYDLIDLSKISFDKSLSYITDMSNFNKEKFPFHTYKNFDLYNVMSVVFKYDLEINENLKLQINKVYYKEKEYYEWLMDIDGFDYSKFNSYWIFYSQTKYHIQRFKKSKKLKEELGESLKKNFIEGVAKIYFRDFV